METISLKLPERVVVALEAEARARGASKSQIVRECIEQRLFTKQGDEESVLDRARQFLGVVKDLPRDIATNPKYMKGFGE